MPPELIFDAGFGELFIVRVAGNVLSPEVAGSLQYAGRHLHTPLFVVLGHTNCGAVGAAIDARLHGTRQHSRIQLLVDSILPGLADLDSQLTPEAMLAQAVEANVRWSMRQILETPEGRERQAEGQREARRRDLRNRDRPRAVSRMSSERCPRSESQILPGNRFTRAAQYPPPQRYCHAMPKAWKSCSRCAL